MSDVIRGGFSKIDRHAQRLFGEVLDERWRQFDKWGDQHHDFTDGDETDWKHLEDECKRRFDVAKANGVDPGWPLILTEEIAEAFAASDMAERRKELVQCAAVIFAIIEDMDGREENAPTTQLIAS